MRLMPRLRSLRCPWAVWLAVLIALVGALAPTVSHALAWDRGGALGAAGYGICTSPGSEIEVSTDSPPGQESALPSLDHCPFCLSFTDRAVPAPAPWVHLFVPLGDLQALSIWQAFFYVKPLALAPPPRGPPCTS